MPDFCYEDSHAPLRVCGIDEAGRGPWAGPVVAACVLFLDREHAPARMHDSKKLSAHTRDAIAAELLANPHHNIIGIGIASVDEIDTHNIWGATTLAMRRALVAMKIRPEMALVDGKIIPKHLNCPAQAIVGGDGISLSIAAASIIAKTTRDSIMRDYAALYPHYGFDRHAGYGTAMHREALATQGPCPIHRKSFKPIRAYLESLAA